VQTSPPLRFRRASWLRAFTRRRCLAINSVRASTRRAEGLGQNPIAAALALAFGVASLTGFALADDSSLSPKPELGVREYHIPAGTMAGALNEIADRNGLHVLYDARVTRGMRTSGLSGAFTVREALDRLLSGTSLKYRVLEEGHTASIVVTSSREIALDTLPPGAMALPVIDIGASPSKESEGPGAPGGANPGGSSSGVVTGPDPSVGVGARGLCAEGVCNDPSSYAAPIQSMATKVNTPSIETPVSIQTVSEQTLLDQQVTSLDQALRNVSNVDIAGGSAYNNYYRYYQYGQAWNVVTVRGFDTDVIFRDGVRLDNLGIIPGLYDTDFGNITSMDVLKGPAAILYGTVEPGGVVNVTTAQPQATPHYSIQQQVAPYASYRTVMQATGPLDAERNLLYHMTFGYTNNGSEVDLAYHRSLLFDPVIKWQITPETSIQFEEQFQQSFDGGYANLVPGWCNGGGACFPILLGRNVNYGERSPSAQETSYTQVRLLHNFDKDWQISVTGFTDRNRWDGILISPTGNSSDTIITLPNGQPAFTRVELVSNTRSDIEGAIVDLTGRFDTGYLKHTLLVGGDYYRYNTHTSHSYDFGSVELPILILDPVHPSAPIGFLPEASDAEENSINTAGGYVQDQIKLPYGMYLMGGARYQYISYTNSISNAACGGLSFLIGLTYVPCTASGGQASHLFRWANRVTPRSGLTWRPLEWFSVYASYVEAYTPNYTAQNIVINTLQPPPPSAGRQTEAGLKFDLLGSKLQATFAVFDLAKTNVVEYVSCPPAAQFCANLYSGFQGLLVQLVGEARSKGFEFDLNGEITPEWSVSPHFSEQEFRTIKGVPGEVETPASVSGPRYLASLATAYEFKRGDLKGLRLGGNWYWKSPLEMGNRAIANFLAGRPLDTPNPSLSYGFVNGFVGYKFDYNGMYFLAQLNVDNLLNRQGGCGITWGAPVSATPGWAYVGCPNAVAWGPATPREFRGLLKVDF